MGPYIGPIWLPYSALWAALFCIMGAAKKRWRSQREKTWIRSRMRAALGSRRRRRLARIWASTRISGIPAGARSGSGRRRDGMQRDLILSFGTFDMKRRPAFLVPVALLWAIISPAGDWPAFRGPTFDGISPEPGAPVRWSETEHVKWKVPVKMPGNGSPIVVAGKVFVTSTEDAEGKGRSRSMTEALQVSCVQMHWAKSLDNNLERTLHDVRAAADCGSGDAPTTLPTQPGPTPATAGKKSRLGEPLTLISTPILFPS